RRVSRSTLYDRTIESLAQLPSTPASDRRRSGIFTTESPMATSPMGPPARPASALSIPKRPGNVVGTTPRPTPRVTSPVKTIPSTANTSRVAVDARKTTTSRRSMSATIPRPLKAPVTALSAGTASVRGKTTIPPRSVVPTKQPSQPPIAQKPVKNSLVSPRKQVAPPARTATVRSASPAVEQDSSPDNTTSKSSSAFRQAIEKAKAAKKAAANTSSGGFDVELDPFNRQSRQSDSSLLLKRIDTARRGGKLLLSGMDLDQIPAAVLQMYDSQSIADSGIAWNEAVDITTFIAADNRLGSLSDDAFPDIDPEDTYSEADKQASIFAAVVRMDIRSNQLLGLPVGLKYLRRLTTLNLSRNELGNSVFEVLSQLESLRELYLAENNINGFLPQSINSLTKLEVLDLSNNRILNVPESIRSMTALRSLNLSSNQLTGVPMDALETLPLVELDVSSNALVGALFPFGVNCLKDIQQLNVSNNSLASLAFSESVSLPNIRILKVSNNRMVSLPDMSGWSELVTLAAGGNKLPTLPQGFVSLRRLRHADFSSNDITRIDERVALMDSLESLVVSANPLVERKFLTMSAEAIKRDLRGRLGSSTQSPRSSDSFEDEAIDVRSPKNSPAPIKISANGELDLSGQGLVDDDADGLRSLLGMHDVRNLQLSRNQFTVIPYELSLAQNLRSLDLSMCGLGSRFLDESLTLMSLQYLQLSGNKITSLEPLMECLHAPHLRQLDVSNNRLSGALPILRQPFVHLQELHAADNKIQSISANAIRGLGTIMLARNDIIQLPADIGLLWFEGLKVVDFSSNAFRVPNYAVLEKGTEATLGWLRNKIPD
ncbi:L domain-like protein, partial [Myriangium duriaei CBS 260.36]